MNFVSIYFIVTFPIIVLIYYWIPHKYRSKLLLMISYLFYIAWNQWVTIVFLGTTLIAYIAGIKIEKKERGKRKWMCLALVSNLGSLFLFKYLGFFTWNIGAIQQFLKISNHIGVLSLVLPVGISFHTFQTLSYVFDVYQKKRKPEENVIYFMLYISFFPQLVAGPIERASSLLPQLKKQIFLKQENIFWGLCFVIRGYIKKILVADVIAPYVDLIYQDPNHSTGPFIIVATILFAIQIYGDFSGYSDIAVGSARMMGIELTQNFNHPYQANSVKDFWRRWHISLSRWFMDYVYIPLGGSRKGKWRQCWNLFVVFILSGLWHGAKWHFIIWGGLHATAVILETLMESARNKRIRRPIIVWKQNHGVVMKKIVTLVFITFSWLFFRAPSLSDAFILVQRMGSGWSMLLKQTYWQQYGFSLLVFVRIVLSVACMVLLEQVTEKRIIGNQILEKPLQKTQISNEILCGYLFFQLLIVLLFSVFLTCANPVSNTFLYFQF